MLQNFKAWLAQPYSDDMDAVHWLYFFGLLIAISIIWALILRTIKEVV